MLSVSLSENISSCVASILASISSVLLFAPPPLHSPSSLLPPLPFPPPLPHYFTPFPTPSLRIPSFVFSIIFLFSSFFILSVSLFLLLLFLLIIHTANSSCFVPGLEFPSPPEELWKITITVIQSPGKRFKLTLLKKYLMTAFCVWNITSECVDMCTYCVYSV